MSASDPLINKNDGSQKKSKTNKNKDGGNIKSPTSGGGGTEFSTIQSKPKGKISAKSLFFCLCVENPFDFPKEPVVDENIFTKQEAVLAVPGGADGTSNPETFLQDDDFLLENEGGSKKTPTAPNRYQKVIEILLRFKARGIDVRPQNMLVASTEKNTANYFHGWALAKNNLLISPDGDELYIKLHASSHVLLVFAETQAVPLLTHEYSYGGGQAMPFSSDLDRRLTESVNLYHKAFGIPAEKLSKKGEGFGFHFDVPHKMRTLLRLAREPWRFGGAGLQINEMRKNGILIKHFFPMHNKAYQKDKGLDRWGSLWPLFSRNPVEQNTDNVISYFGEQVALYFVWVKELTLFLRWLALPALVAGFMSEFGYRGAVVKACFAFICVIWGGCWCVRWSRKQREFSVIYGQDEQMSQEPVRDEFAPADERVVSYKDIFELNFSYPLSLQNRMDGTMINLYYSNTKRICIRYAISYPIVIFITLVMVAALIAVTWWRFENADSVLINYMSSIITVLISNIFGFLFEKAVGLLNSRENNRTDSEEESQTIMKNFFFYFFSFYFALFSIILYPLDSLPDSVRLDQLKSQMLIITIVKPMVQNLQELLLPIIKSELRVRIDMLGVCGTICSVLTCRTRRQLLERIGKGDDLSEVEEEGKMLWMESQMEPYESTSDDYLEITLQFGYMTMFASTFPWAAVAALAYNALELRIDAKKLLDITQRTVAKPATDIGPWSSIFVLLTMLSVVTNCYMVMILSDANQTFQFDGDAARWQAYVIFQYIAVFVMLVVVACVGTTPDVFYKTRAKQYLLSNKASREKMRHVFKEMVIARKAIEEQDLGGAHRLHLREPV